jgi:hypothetical protein
MNNIPNPLPVPSVLDVLGQLLTIPPFLMRSWEWQMATIPLPPECVFLLVVLGWLVLCLSTRGCHGR